MECPPGDRRRSGRPSGHAPRPRSADRGPAGEIRGTGTYYQPGPPPGPPNRGIPPAVTILDSYAVIAFLRAEPAAQEVRPLLDGGDATLTAVGIAEVLDHLVRLAGVNEEDAALDLAQLGLLEGVVVDSDLAVAAGRLRARRCHRTRCAISMADCIAAEAARSTMTSVATSDPHLLDTCHVENISVIVLSASDGTRWTPRHQPT